MNKEKLTEELIGHRLRLLDLLTKKDVIIKEIELKNRQVKEMDEQISIENTIIQTLEFMDQTDGFTNLPQEKVNGSQNGPQNGPNGPNRPNGS